ncbi:unnamed protein product [Amoebophrya sp. A120]|nr:unnamed protein product [Amoebophrya sp. A120]|eukprot:GSA120T00017568001.1
MVPPMSSNGAMTFSGAVCNETVWHGDAPKFFCPAAGSEVQFLGCDEAVTSTTTTTSTSTTVCICHNGDLESTGTCPGQLAEYCSSCHDNYRLRENWPADGQKSCFPTCGGATCLAPDPSDGSYYVSRLEDTYCMSISAADALAPGVFPVAGCRAGCCRQGCKEPDAQSDLRKRVDVSGLSWHQLLTGDSMLPPMAL